MKIELIIYTSFLLLSSCQNTPHHEGSASRDSNAVVANRFVDAFYSFNRDSLESILSDARESHPSILYYQQWAACGNYKIVHRDKYLETNDSLVIFPVTVEDDLMAALGIEFNVTDTFKISIRNGHIRSVTTSSNDPEIYYEAKKWVQQNRPDLVEKACEGIWEGGPKPCECVQGMVKGFSEFKAKRKTN